MKAPAEPATPWKDFDAAHRLADTIREAHAKAGGVATVAAKMATGERDFIAVNLGTGGWDRELYPSRDVALKHQMGDRNQYAYIPVPPAPWSPRSCDTLLWYWRRVYDNGYRPDGVHEGIVIARTPNAVEYLT